MSDEPAWRSTPGPEGRMPPRTKVIWSQDVPWRDISVLVGNTQDEGKVKRLIHPETTGSPDTEFFFGLYRMEPGQYHALHYHPNGSEFYYVLSGSGQFRVDEELIDGGPGLALYFPPNTRHSVRVTGSEPLTLVYGFSPPDWETVGIVWEE